MLQKYYNILGLSTSATEAEVKTAYRKLAIKFHPDTNPGNETKFLEIAEAYQVLTGKKKPNPLNLNPTNHVNEEKIFVRKYNKWLTKAEYQNLVRATQNYHKQKIKEEEEEDAKEFDELKKSKTYKSFKYSAVLGVLFSVLLMVDYYTKQILEKGIIDSIEIVTIDKEDPYKGIVYQLQESLITVSHNNKNSTTLRLSTNISDFLKKGQPVEVIKSSVFNLNMGIKDEILTYDTDKRRFKGFQWFLVIFCCSLIVLTPILEAPTPIYYMMLHLSTYGIPFILSCFILYVFFY